MQSVKKKQLDLKNCVYTAKNRALVHNPDPYSFSNPIIPDPQKNATLPKTEDLVRIGLVNNVNFPHVLNFEDRDWKTIRKGTVASYCEHKIHFNPAFY